MSVRTKTHHNFSNIDIWASGKALPPIIEGGLNRFRNQIRPPWHMAHGTKIEAPKNGTYRNGVSVHKGYRPSGFQKWSQNFYPKSLYATMGHGTSKIEAPKTGTYRNGVSVHKGFRPSGFQKWSQNFFPKSLYATMGHGTWNQTRWEPNFVPGWICRFRRQKHQHIGNRPRGIQWWSQNFFSMSLYATMGHGTWNQTWNFFIFFKT